MDLEHLSLLFEVLNVYARYREQTPTSAAAVVGGALATPIDSPVEALRMALTNVPVDYQRIEAAWATVAQQLDGAMCAAERSALHKRFADLLDQSNSTMGGPPKPFWSSSVVPAYRAKSCYVQQEMHCVLPGKLFVGSYHPAADRAILDQHGITHICCCINVSPRFPAHYQYLTLPADDAVDYDIGQFFATSFDFIDRALTNSSSSSGSDGRVLVHCGAGISRAPTITAAYLMRKFGLRANDAVKHIKKIRTCASPNRGFVERLQKLEQELRQGAS